MAKRSKKVLNPCYQEAYAACRRGDLKTVSLEMLASEIALQAKYDGEGDEAFRNKPIIFRWFDTARGFTLPEIPAGVAAGWFEEEE